ncbi:MAG: aminoglycoside phosphotransferase family protein [Ktedonobacteraceae bacterium]
MEPVELLQRINALHRTTFALVEKYSDGEQGAFAITDHLGRRYVLKWAADARNLSWMQGARTVTDLLRSVGYPAPRYLFIDRVPGGIYSIQSALPGSPLRSLTTTLLPRLLALNELQVGRAIPGRKDWHQEVINTVLFGGDGYCLHTSLQQFSRDTADLLQELQALVVAYQDEPHRTSDIVHGDFQHSNILIDDGQVSGIIDWDGSFAGDCVFDIATLLFYSYDVVKVRERLWDYVLERVSIRLVSMYLAHLILRQVDWSLRHHDQATSRRYITRGQILLEEIRHRFYSADQNSL